VVNILPRTVGRPATVGSLEGTDVGAREGDREGENDGLKLGKAVVGAYVGRNDCRPIVGRDG
jgi:hypothetical protein